MEQTAYDILILAYLAERPDAQDTLEGVAQWWLPKQAVKSNTVQVEEALAKLVDEGLVLERSGKDARTYYKVNRRRLKEIRKMKEVSALLARRGSWDAPED
jgi:hypothetical protein